MTGAKRALCVLAALALAAAPAAVASRGGDLYFANCVWCHGADLRGVDVKRGHSAPGGGRAGGPPLRGVGAQAADLYLRLGYMPLRDARERPYRRTPHFTNRDMRALVAFVAAAGGPPVPQPHPERGNVAQGMTLFTEHCAGCHTIVGEGGIVTGTAVPSLKHANATQIAEAVRVGPYVMPRFDRHAISARELDSLVRYVLYTKHPNDQGGWALGNLGPFPEGMVAWLVAGAALLVVARLIGEGLKR